MRHFSSFDELADKMAKDVEQHELFHDAKDNEKRGMEGPAYENITLGHAPNGANMTYAINVLCQEIVELKRRILELENQ